MAELRLVGAGVIGVVLALGAAGPMGCLSVTKKDRPVAMGELPRGADEARAWMGQLDETMRSLDALMAAGTEDLRPAFEAFSVSTDRLATAASDLQAKAIAMRDKGPAYFESWDADRAGMTGEIIEKREEARAAEVRAEFTRLSDVYQAAAARLGPVVTALKDVRGALVADLTPGGLRASRSFVATARREAEGAREALRALGKRFEELGV